MQIKTKQTKHRKFFWWWVLRGIAMLWSMRGFAQEVPKTRIAIPRREHQNCWGSFMTVLSVSLLPSSARHWASLRVMATEVTVNDGINMSFKHFEKKDFNLKHWFKCYFLYSYSPLLIALLWHSSHYSGNFLMGKKRTFMIPLAFTLRS